MLVEITGLSSAGKSTLLDQLLRSTSPDFSAVSIGTDRALAIIGLSAAKGITRRMALTGLAAAGWATSGRAGFTTARALVDAHRASCLPPRSWPRWNGTTYAAMQLGLVFLLRRLADSDELVLLDTGPLHTVYNFFVDLDQVPDGSSVAAYLDRVTLADQIVWLHQDRQVIIERTTSRTHRRVKNLDEVGAATFHDNALTAFGNLHDRPSVAERLLELDLSLGTPDAETVINRIAARSAGPVDHQ